MTVNVEILYIIHQNSILHNEEYFHYGKTNTTYGCCTSVSG